jgi:hypothetical protein
MKPEAKLQELYDKIPEPPECLKGCTKCCAPTMLLPAEKKILGTAECITPHDPVTLKCEFIKDGCCSVYDKRPFVCRIFNATPCPPFTCPEMNRHGSLSQEQIAELMDEFFNLLCITPADEVVEYLQCMEKYQQVMVEHDARNGWIERSL